MKSVVKGALKHTDTDKHRHKPQNNASCTTAAWLVLILLFTKREGVLTMVLSQ